MDEFTMLTKKNKNDGDDNVNIDVFQGRRGVEFEETNPMNIQTNISKKDALASDTTNKNCTIGALRRKQNRWAGKRKIIFKQEISKRKKCWWYSW